jgi:hypothetical protein
MKRFIGREVTWFLATLLLAFLLALLGLSTVDMVGDDRPVSGIERVFEAQLFIVVYLLCFWVYTWPGC